MEAQTSANDPYGDFPWPDDYRCESMDWYDLMTEHERTTMLELLDYPNPVGLHENEARWRDLARKLKERRQTCLCEGGFLPTVDGGFTECYLCAPQFV